VAQESLGGSAAWVLIGTAGGIGAVLGDAAALRFRPRRPLMAGGLAVSLWALEPALLARPFPTAVVAIAAAVGFGASGFSNAVWFTALQERIPRASLSRVSSFDWLGSIVFQPAGFALAGPLAAAIGVPATLLVSGALQASACLAFSLPPSVRNLRSP
jgi:predicted MFS family arabinose efflux permease